MGAAVVKHRYSSSPEACRQRSGGGAAHGAEWGHHAVGGAAGQNQGPAAVRPPGDEEAPIRRSTRLSMEDRAWRPGPPCRRQSLGHVEHGGGVSGGARLAPTGGGSLLHLRGRLLWSSASGVGLGVSRTVPSVSMVSPCPAAAAWNCQARPSGCYSAPATPEECCGQRPSQLRNVRRPLGWIWWGAHHGDECGADDAFFTGQTSQSVFPAGPLRGASPARSERNQNVRNEFTA